MTTQPLGFVNRVLLSSIIVVDLIQMPQRRSADGRQRFSISLKSDIIDVDLTSSDDVEVASSSSITSQKRHCNHQMMSERFFCSSSQISSWPKSRANSRAVTSPILASRSAPATSRTSTTCWCPAGNKRNIIIRWKIGLKGHNTQG